MSGKNKAKMSQTFYRRQLPSPSVPFASKDGKQLFREALADGYMEGYFVLAEQFRTQDEPAFCGVSTLTMVLNALAVDPKRVWKGPWRWYNESMLDCCRSLDEIKQTGINFDQFVCLGRCNYLKMEAKRPNQQHLYPSKQSKEPIIKPQLDEKEEINAPDDNTNEHKQAETGTGRKYFSIDEFRQDIKLSCVSSNDPVVIVSYSRKGLKQTGDGHFSPIGGYHRDKDMCLIMDVARFKYPPHWVSTQVLYNAMCRVDASCNKTRGWIVATCAGISKSYFFTLQTSTIDETNVVDLNDNICCCAAKFTEQTLTSCQCANDVDGDANRRWTEMEVIKCLLFCLPAPMNRYLAIQTEKFGVEIEESHQLVKEKLMNGLRSTGMYEVVTRIFGDDRNKALSERFKHCWNRLEMITLMVLIIGDESVWTEIAKMDETLRTRLCALSVVDNDTFPELVHEIVALRHQIKHLRQYLLTTYSKTIANKSCCSSTIMN